MGKERRRMTSDGGHEAVQLSKSPLHSKPSKRKGQHSKSTNLSSFPGFPTVFHTGRLPKTGLRLTRDSRDRESEAHAPDPPCAFASQLRIRRSDFRVGQTEAGPTRTR